MQITIEMIESKEFKIKPRGYAPRPRLPPLPP